MSNFDNALEQGRELVRAARLGEFAPVRARDLEIRELDRSLAQGLSVLLVGQDGVGKTAVVHGLAELWKDQDRGLVELSTTTMMAGTKYLGEWQSKVTEIAKQAAAAPVVLYIPDVWNLPKTGRTEKNDNNLLDALRPHISSGRVRILAEASPGTLRMMERTPGFVSLFKQLAIAPLSGEAVRRCVVLSALSSALALSPSALESVLSLSQRFSGRTQPGPALELLAHLERQRKEDPSLPSPLQPLQVERAFSTLSGLPLFVVSRTETRPVKEIRAWFQDRIVGQHEAIEAVLECIALFKAGLQDPDKPIGTFLFVGPTGVGKTELARTLARFLFGSDSRLLRFDLSEYKDYHSFEMLVGSSREPGRPAALVDPIRAQPFQVVLFDELEKAHPNVWDLLLGLLDEGRITPPGGRTVDCRNTIVIATSNIGAHDSQKAAVGFDNQASHSAQRRRIEKALEQHFRPEFLNRFQHLCVFHALTAEQVTQVARWEIKRVVDREGVAARDLVVEVEDAALAVLVDKGFDPRYGARGLKREIQRRIVLPLAMTLMEKQVEPGSILRVVAREQRIQVRVVETSEARAQRRSRDPVKLPDGRKLNQAQLIARAGAIEDRLSTLSTSMDEQSMLDRQQELELLRGARDFWTDPSGAVRVMRDLEQLGLSLDRLDRLRMSTEELQADAATATRQQADSLGARLIRLESRVLLAERQLIRMGPNGVWDALIHIEPLGRGGDKVCDLLVGVYQAWAAARKLELLWLHDPLSPTEATTFSIQGSWAHGLLAHEAGLHRLKQDRDSYMARVRVAPWTDARGTPAFGPHRALKGQVGRFGTKLRSRIELQGGLVLQNERTLAANRELAVELVESLRGLSALDQVVRLYCAEPPMVKDHATGLHTQRKDALTPKHFHALLCERVDSL